VPQLSTRAEPFGVPAQSAQDVLSPSQTSHSSNSAEPPQVPAQSWIQSFAASVSHVPQLSTRAEPFGVPAQSAQDVLSPSQTSHSSNSA